LCPEPAGETRATSSSARRTLVERWQDGLLCNMENQLILGYEDEGFSTAQPWGDGCGGLPPATLTFGSWEEFGSECHVNFLVFREVPKSDEGTIVRDALQYAVDLFRNPGEHSLEPYGVGPCAYGNWERVVEVHGSSHGSGWNATVWSECREMATAFFGEIAGRRHGEVAEAALELEEAYTEIAALLGRAGSKEMPAEEKAAIMRDLKSRELAAIERIERLLPRIAVAADS
jgi:hypothetical protein